MTTQEILSPERIRAARLRLNLSQTEFGKLIGKYHPHHLTPTVDSVSRWELGKDKPSMLYRPILTRMIEWTEERSRHEQAKG